MRVFQTPRVTQERSPFAKHLPRTLGSFIHRGVPLPKLDVECCRRRLFGMTDLEKWKNAHLRSGFCLIFLPLLSSLEAIPGPCSLPLGGPLQPWPLGFSPAPSYWSPLARPTGPPKCGRQNGPPKCVCPDLQILWIRDLTWKRGLCSCD